MCLCPPSNVSESFVAFGKKTNIRSSLCFPFFLPSSFSMFLLRMHWHARPICQPRILASCHVALHACHVSQYLLLFRLIAKRKLEKERKRAANFFSFSFSGNRGGNFFSPLLARMWEYVEREKIAFDWSVIDRTEPGLQINHLNYPRHESTYSLSTPFWNAP